MLPSWLGLRSMGSPISAQFFLGEREEKIMGRRKDSQLRNHFYELGNTMCPICLKSFADEEGAQPTLEHVPPKGHEGVKSVVMCLTCKGCNHQAGNTVDAAAIAAMRTPKAELHIPGTDHPYKGNIEVDANGTIIMRYRSPSSFPAEAFASAIRDRKEFTIAGAIPNVHYVKTSGFELLTCLSSLFSGNVVTTTQRALARRWYVSRY